MVYSITSDVRELAKSILAADFSNAEIIEEQEMAHSKIKTFTKKSDWTSSDTEFEYIKKLETKQAAIYVLEHRDTTGFDQLLAAWTVEIDTGLEKVLGSRTDPSLDIAITVVSSNYESYPASLEDNDQAIPYRSTNIHV